MEEILEVLNEWRNSIDEVISLIEDGVEWCELGDHEDENEMMIDETANLIDRIKSEILGSYWQSGSDGLESKIKKIQRESEKVK
jgi:hypothetical protein